MRSGSPGPVHREIDHPLAELGVIDAGGGGGFGEQTGFGHAWKRVDLEDQGFAVGADHDVHARVVTAADGREGRKGGALRAGSRGAVQLRGAEVFGPTGKWTWTRSRKHRILA